MTEARKYSVWVREVESEEKQVISECDLTHREPKESLHRICKDASMDAESYWRSRSLVPIDTKQGPSVLKEAMFNDLLKRFEEICKQIERRH